MGYQLEVMLSNRHMHAAKELREKLFGSSKLTPNKYIGEAYSTEETVTLRGPKGKIEGVRLICEPGHERTQIELLKSDCYKLGIKAPVRYSGDLADAAPLEIIGTAGTVKLDHVAIVALRHAHIGNITMERLGIRDGDIAKIKVGGERGLVFDNVTLRASGDYDGGVVHLDMEEGNAAGLKNHDIVEILLSTDEPAGKQRDK